MAYARFRLRRRVLQALDKIPDKIVATNIDDVVDACECLRVLYDDFTKEPFEFVSRDTRDEHRRLADIFSELFNLVHGMFEGALSCFRSGDVEFAVDADIVDLKNRLSEDAKGDSAMSILLTKFAKRNGDDDPPEKRSGSPDNQEKEAETFDAAAGVEDAQRT